MADAELLRCSYMFVFRPTTFLLQLCCGAEAACTIVFSAGMPALLFNLWLIRLEKRKHESCPVVTSKQRHKTAEMN